jgi:FkbM family methyltransferase
MSANATQDGTLQDGTGPDQSVTQLKECRHGKMLFLRRDVYIGRSLDLYGEFSELEGVVFRQLVGPDQVVVEVGANIGAHTVHLAKLVGPRGMVIAFEPQRIIFQLLCANVALNELFNVRTYHAAAGQQPGALKVPPLDYAAANNFGGLSLGHAAQGENVPVMTLDQLVLPSLRLLKIDVEGMEIDVLSGARQLIAKHRPILYVEDDRRPNSERLISLIEDMGYSMWWHTPPLFNPDNFNRCAENIMGRVVSANLLCMPNEMAVTIHGFRKVTGPGDWWGE